MTRQQLSNLSGVSVSSLADITRGKANPSLKVMTAIAVALETPLPLLLEDSDLSQEVIDTLTDHKIGNSVPPGYQRISAVLPDHRAYQVKKWAAGAKKKLKSLPK